MKILLLLGVILAVGLVSAQEPPKHPKDICLDEWNACAESAEPDNQVACLPKYYTCLNAYTAKCRELYRNKGCYHAIGKDECWKKLKVCYGHPPEGE